MKNKTIILASVLALSLCLTACEKTSENSESSSSSAESSSSSAEISSSSAEKSSSESSSSSEESSSNPAPNNFPESFTGFLGETIYTADASEKYDYMLRYNSFAYLRWATPVFDNNLKTPDLFNLDTFECPKYDGKLTQKNPEWFVIKPGDVLENGLKVKSTITTFEQWGTESGGKTVGQSEMNITFEGELTVTGVLVCAGKDDVYVTPGDLFFFADTTKDVKIPLVPINDTADEFSLKKFVFDDFAFVTDGMWFRVGDLESVSVDLDGIIKRGQAVNVKVTLEEIRVASGYTSSSTNHAKIKSIELI